MQHLDEARIVEYLDLQKRGARTTPPDVEEHLATCAECRAVAERLRDERDRVAAILARSGPADITPPPFDQIAERAARARRPGGGAARILALAATAVIVVGVGWLGRDYALREREPATLAVQDVQVAELEVERDAAEGFRNEARSAPVEPPIPVPTPTPAPVAAPAAPAVTGAMRQVAQQAKGEDDGAAANERPVARPPARAADALAQGRADADTPRVALAERAEMAPPTADEAPSVASAAGRGVAAEPELRARRTVGARWESITRADAERVLGGAVQVIEGLAVLEHALDRGDGGRVRTLQVLGPDVSLELIQMQGASREQAGAGDTNVVALARNGFIILARAPISRDSLEVLLRRLRPQTP